MEVDDRGSGAGVPDPLAFDLNDVSREPSDEQLAALMEAVGAEARRKATAARERYALELHEAMAEAGVPEQLVEQCGRSATDRRRRTQRCWNDVDHRAALSHEWMGGCVYVNRT